MINRVLKAVKKQSKAKVRKNGKGIVSRIDPYVQTLLGKISNGKDVMAVRKGQILFAQGDRSDAIFFIESGRVKISVISGGKEAVLAMLGPRKFFGEGALVGQSLRVSTATALVASTVFRVQKGAMTRALHDQASLSQ